MSNGSSNLFKDNVLILCSNELHTPILLNLLNFKYVALQEVGMNLNSDNINIQYEKPAIIDYKWDSNFRYHLKCLSDYEKTSFLKTLVRKTTIIFY